MKRRFLTLAIVGTLTCFQPAISYAGVGGANPPPKHAAQISQIVLIMQIFMSMSVI
ncbi:hypothetical protein HDF16_005938 [Granulicella aggregans]|uniref:Uncharacterized protein n=1 Tax=Granulicella aggregans TaxID=474949 RepID=A0A7W8E701_9BACT|nr:hypothetical protein [Granulicella aggregans]